MSKVALLRTKHFHELVGREFWDRISRIAQERGVLVDSEEFIEMAERAYGLALTFTYYSIKSDNPVNNIYIFLEKWKRGDFS